MDDEEMIIHTARNLLEILGCEVTAVTMGLHALQMVEENPRGFDMVISDLTMPQLTGEQVARRLKKNQSGSAGYHNHRQQRVAVPEPAGGVGHYAA